MSLVFRVWASWARTVLPMQFYQFRRARERLARKAGRPTESVPFSVARRLSSG